MADQNDDKPSKPDLRLGVPSSEIRDGELLCGTVGDDEVILTRVDGAVVAYGGICPHLAAPLEKGRCDGGVLRCPWHHARFDLRTGEAIAAPAFDALPKWTVATVGDRVVVTGKAPDRKLAVRYFEGHSEPGIVIVGGGATGYAAAHELRRRGHEGPVTMVSNDTAGPYDRTLLSKDYLDGKFGDDHLPIARKSLDDLGVSSLVGVSALSLNTAAHHVRLSDGRSLVYTKLLLATGAEPKRLEVPGADLPHVHLLRSLADCRAILATPQARHQGCRDREQLHRPRSRGVDPVARLDVTVVTPETAPMARIVWASELSRAIVAKHTRQRRACFGCRPKVGGDYGSTPSTRRTAARLPADLVIVGIGVTPRIGSRPCCRPSGRATA